MEEYSKAKNFIKSCKEKDLKVAFIHGVFDLIHIEHIRTLNEAKKLADILIVGVDSDNLVKVFKTNIRPIINDLQRLEMVRNLKPVDYAFMLDSSTQKDNSSYIKLYEYLDFDILISGPNKYEKEYKRRCDILNIKYVCIKHPIKITTTTIIKNILNSEKNQK